jgi:GT2 family glycosyltransferase
MDISVIIVNYNTTSHLKKCLDSIIKNIKNSTYEILVVDNCSTDRSIESFLDFYPNIKFFFLNKNNGFGAGCNFGVSKSYGKYILLLNPDTFLESDIITKFFSFMEDNENIGVCSALSEGLDGKIQYCYNDFPSLIWEFYELTSYLLNRRIRKLNEFAVDNSSKSDSIEIDWAIGANLFISRDVFNFVNGFDEKFFLYYEDTDLQKRIRNKGYRIMLLNRLRIKHEGKSSIEESEEGNNIYYLNMHISKLRYYYKHSSRINVLIVRIINIIAYFLRIVKLPFKNQRFSIKKDRYRMLIKILKIYFKTQNEIIA